MKKAPRDTGLRMAFLSALALLLLAGCTLKGSGGLGEATPVPGGEGTDGGGAVLSPVAPAASPTSLPTLIPAATQTPQLSDLEILGTEAAVTATAQAAGGTTADTGTTPAAITPSAPAVAAGPTSSIGGEILPPTNTPIGTPVAVQPTACPPTHTVAQGENLYRIALRYGTTYQELAAANGIANPNQISVGVVLNIPCEDTTPQTQQSTEEGAAATTNVTPGSLPGGTTHVVQPGENLFRIALQYNMTWTTLAAYNGITNPNTLVVGQTLRIP